MGGVLALAGRPRPAFAGDAELLKAVRRREYDAQRGGAGDVARRLEECVEQVGRITTLAKAGEYRAAREQLRVGALAGLRKDVLTAGDLLKLERPSFERFEATSVMGPLEALDASLRKCQQGGGACTDAVGDAKMLRDGLQDMIEPLRRKNGTGPSADAALPRTAEEEINYELLEAAAAAAE